MAFSRTVGLLSAVFLICVALPGCEKGDTASGTPRPADAGASKPEAKPAPAVPASPRPAATQATQPAGHPPMPTPAPKLGDDRLLRLTGLTMEVPEGWTEEPIAPGPFAAKAVFRIPAGDEGETCSVRVTHYPNMKGMDEMNIQRWAQQILLPDGTPATKDSAVITMSTNPSGTIKLTVVELEGSLRTDMRGSGPALPNQKMMAGILDHAQGPHFFKITGPIEAMAKVDDAISSFILSATTE